MGVVTDVAESAVGISASTWFTVGLLAIFSTAVLVYHHHVYESGFAACNAAYKAGAEKQAASAQLKIKAIGNEYAVIETSLLESPVFAKPASSLVSDAIGRMPEPHAKSK